MKIQRNVMTEVDVEVSVDIEDIVNALLESPDHMRHVDQGLNNIYRFLSAISNEMIAEMKPEKKEIIRNYLKEQSERFNTSSEH